MASAERPRSESTPIAEISDDFATTAEAKPSVCVMDPTIPSGQTGSRPPPILIIDSATSGASNLRAGRAQ